MCGIIGIFSNKPVAQEIYDGMVHLQHRGQDAAGIITCDEKFHQHKTAGLVRDLFQEKNSTELNGNWGIGHTRYATAGGIDIEDAQPFWTSDPYGVALAYNGNLVNHQELLVELKEKRHRYVNSTCDAEVILKILTDEMHNELTKNNTENFFELICSAIKKMSAVAVGSYSIVCLVIGKGLIAYRDPHGIRPLVYGKRENSDGTTDYIFASENTMFYSLGFKPLGDLAPNEIIFINTKGEMRSRILERSFNEQNLFTPCMFEYVYFARPDAMINNISVYRARLRLGQNLAIAWQKKYPDILPDVIIPAPFTSTTAAQSMAHNLDVRCSDGLYKNQFIGRTFIMPGQEIRKKSVRYKLNPQETEIRDKKVMLLDDSIVRGTTSQEIIKMIREFGAKEVYFVSTCPPVKFPCFYGVDLPSKKELISSDKTEEEVREFIGADILLFQEIDDLVEAITRKGEHNIDRLCMACLDGWYVTGEIDENKMQKLSEKRLNEKNI